jgi:hypothetical protein
MRKESPATPTLNSTVKNGTIVNYYQDDTFGVNLFQDDSLKSVNLFQDVSKEQAEVGQSPTLLALRFATGVLRILRGYFRAFLPMKEKKTGYLGVFCINR